jgi:putative thioredoxin
MFGNDNIIDVSESTFEEDVLEQSWEMPVVVDFWAPWCGPCRMLGPILEKLANEPDGNFVLAKVNVDENPNLSIRYGVRGIPAVKAFSQGQVVSEFVGAQPEPVVRQFIKRVAPTSEDALLIEADTLLATHHWQEAEMSFRDVLDEFPNDEAATLGLARSLLAQGQGDEALDLLKTLRDGEALTEAEALLPLAVFLRDYEESGLDVVEGGEEIRPIDAQYQLAAHLFSEENWEAGLDGLLEVLRIDKAFKNGSARKVILAVFALFGSDADITQQYRRELALVLF